MSLQVKSARMMSQGSVRPRYPQGDPGLLGGILGGIGGFLTGGPAGAIAGAVGGWKSGSGQPAQTLAPPQSRPPINLPGFGPPGVGIGGQRNRISFGEQPMAQGGKAPSGYHWNKSGYYLKDGTYIAPGTKLVKNRRKNAMNPRALRRALSRVNMAKRWQSTLSEVTTSKYTAAGKKKACS